MRVEPEARPASSPSLRRMVLPQTYYRVQQVTKILRQDVCRPLGSRATVRNTIVRTVEMSRQKPFARLA